MSCTPFFRTIVFKKHLFFIIFHIFQIVSFPNSFKMHYSQDDISMIITNVIIYTFICLNLIVFLQKAHEHVIYIYVANGH